MYRLIAIIFMITETLTHAQKSIKEKIIDKEQRGSLFQDFCYNDDGYPDYSDYAYLDATHW